MSGKVYLIGAGPGHPGLLTLRGAELLARCEVVLFDGLCNPKLLDHAPKAVPICVGKHGRSRIWKQSEIIEEMLEHARAGKNVARLKGGDPAVFARTAEEVEALRNAGIEYEIVPGITAALAAGSYAGVPVTHRELASAVALVTGHEEPGKSESALDWDALAKFPGTLVIYMGVTTAEQWTSALIQSGKDPSTPAALIRRCSHTDQQVIHCRLDEIAQRLTPASKFRPPVVAIVGDVAELASSWDWVQTRPLHNRVVLVSRPANQSVSLTAPLQELGADVVTQPAILLRPPEDWSEIDSAIESIAETDILIFCSANGVKYFFSRLFEKHGDGRLLASTEIAAVGEKTSQALRQHSLIPDVIPPDFHAKSLANTLAPAANQKRVTIIRASRGSDVLPKSLADAGAIVTEVVGYRNEDIETPDEAVVAMMKAGEIDWVTITSSASAENLHRMFGSALSNVKIATLGKATSATVHELGLDVVAEAQPHTMEGLVNSILNKECEFA